MLSELDVVVFVKSHEDLARVAERIFGALGSTYREGPVEDMGVPNYQADGFGLHAILFANEGELQDLEFASYQYALEINSRFADVELEQIDLEGLLAEYYARFLAFSLNVETATAILVEEREDAEVFELRAFNRNTQYRSDSGPTVPKTHVIETNEFEVAIGDQEWDEEDLEEEDVAEEL